MCEALLFVGLSAKVLSPLGHLGAKGLAGTSLAGAFFCPLMLTGLVSSQQKDRLLVPAVRQRNLLSQCSDAGLGWLSVSLGSLLLTYVFIN